MRPVILALTLFSGSALAETHFDKYLGSIGEASMEGDRVDVPLFHGPMGSTTPMVQVTIGDAEYLFGLASSNAQVWVSERVASEQKIDAKVGNKKLINFHGEKNKFKLGGEAGNGTLPELKIGGLTLSNLNVSTKASKNSQADQAQGGKSWYSSRSRGTAVDGIIGLGALPEGISWAVAPSQGTVSFARQGEGLIAGGTTIPYTIVESEVIQWGKRKLMSVAQPVVSAVSISGVEMPAHIEIGVSGSYYMWPTDIPADVSGSYADVDRPYASVEVSGLKLGSATMLEFTSLDGVARSEYALLGQDLLNSYDVAMDRTAQTITLKKVDEVKREDPLPSMLAHALKAVAPEESEETPSGEAETSTEGDSSESDLPGKGSDWGRLIDLYMASGDVDSAITAATNAVELNKRDCTDWKRLGVVQASAGNIAESIVAFETASTIYHGWYDLSLEQRTEIKAELDKLDADEKEAHEHTVAASSCHTADAHLAGATFAAGDLLTVEQIYREHFDLDPTLGVITGNALITQGELAHAAEPLRQAMKTGGAQSMARLSLAVVYAEQGNWESASKLFERVISDGASTQTLKVWLDAVVKAEGPAAALEQMSLLVKQQPESASVRVGLAYAMAHSASAPQKAKARRSAETFWKKRLARFPRSGAVAGDYARWLNQWEPGSDAALSAAEKAHALDPTASDVFMALAEIHAARDNATDAHSWTVRAAQSAPEHIGYARLFGSTSAQ